MEAMLDLRRQSPDVADRPDAHALPPICDRRGGELVFDDVSFRHSARTQGLSHVSFTAAPGETVALVGPSGAGKTSAVRLALRLIDPKGGRVLIDGSDLRDITQASIRE